MLLQLPRVVSAALKGLARGQCAHRPTIDLHRPLSVWPHGGQDRGRMGDNITSRGLLLAQVQGGKTWPIH